MMANCRTTVSLYEVACILANFISTSSFFKTTVKFGRIHTMAN
jgi:hypothetical protein